MNTERFIIHIKTEDFYEHISDKLKKNMIHQIMKLIDHCVQERVTTILIDER